METPSRHLDHKSGSGSAVCLTRGGIRTAAACKASGGSINSDPSTSDDLASELQHYERQAINQDAKALLGDLSERQLEWREDVACWSISDCVNHLVVTGNQSLSHIRSAIVTARSKGMLSAGPFRHPVAGKLLILLMDAPPRVRFKAPKAYRPANDLSVSDMLAAFWVLQNELAHALRDANGVDLARESHRSRQQLVQDDARARVAFTAAHERRHLWQAWRVRQKLLSMQSSCESLI
jgi:hypothetical protein